MIVFFGQLYVCEFEVEYVLMHSRNISILTN